MIMGPLSNASLTDTYPSANSGKLSSHSTEFEGMLLSQWIESAEKTFASPPDQSSDPAFDTLSGMGAKALGMELARSNALGIGRMIAQSLSHSALSSEQSSATK